jgi:hypothetical protein
VLEIEGEIANLKLVAPMRGRGHAEARPRTGERGLLVAATRGAYPPAWA